MFKSSAAGIALGLALTVAGSLTSPACGGDIYPGKWIDTRPTPDWEVAIDEVEFAVHVPNDEILIWKSPGGAQLWSRVNGKFTPAPGGGDLFEGCSAHTSLADGNVLLAGGNGPSAIATIFDYATGEWSADVPDMAFLRWYPTGTTLADGKVLVTGGNLTGPCSTAVWQVEVFDPDIPPDGGWESPINPAGGPFDGPCKYPLMFLTPTGTLFWADGEGPNLDTWELDLVSPQWVQLGSSYPVGGQETDATAVMYRPGEVLKCGGTLVGGIDPIKTTKYINLNDQVPTWSSNPSHNLTLRRKNHNLVLLPDGRILAVGGEDPVWCK